MKRVALICAVLVAVVATFVVTTGFSGYGHPAYLVRAIFDDASFAVQGEDVRVAGANVGTIQSLGVTSGKQAAVTLAITDQNFSPFYANASCAIRPQSLIGEEYVDCNPGTSNAAPLSKITRGPGSGSHYLPVTQTSSPIDFDIAQDISTEPVRQALAVLIDEFGTGLAARGSDLNAVIRRANPALGNTDRVLQILVRQDHELAQLSTDSDTVLKPLARERQQLAGFVTQANTTAVASAARAADISKTFKLFPSFLRQLRPLMADLGQLADQGTPLMNSLGQSAGALGRQFANLTPFASKARTALIELGASAREEQPDLVATLPLAQRLKKLGSSAAPSASLLDQLTASIEQTGGIEQLMNLLFQGAAAGNGFDSLGHYLRAEPLVSNCTNYATSPGVGCSANFSATAAAASVSDARIAGVRSADRLVARAVREAAAASRPSSTLPGLLKFLTGSQW